MERDLFGFLINSDIQVDIDNRRLTKVSSEGTDNVINFGAITLKETMMRLLVYLLTHANDVAISKDEILVKVWDENNLTSSNQRLSQMIGELQSKLSIIGVPTDFIINVRGVGYKVNGYCIRPLYY
ncbi:winged helix-turn-helix domain-containing protein [Budviciaceae bacterium CWB-B4]|uniref:Winged helix-turn-helix domain-containing protein n=1 Tax=Limnobaculum xujianqingii TaxID=2738837 RepID=A0A9D7AIC7_9GAMM|nr:winged helix-turn-helix domain-containing protein [Limnobaculum xujianqingii]MBK5073681.1 winged helix-turn-helix domain-containing protein [Limnobaculum xujianqingii]MBK5176588.1 winged helix-turn-helix domain-containing protein [Limnobaculum xujianqingii]